MFINSILLIEIKVSYNFVINEITTFPIENVHNRK